MGRVVACVACFSVSASASLLGRSASSACGSINQIMLETGEIYLATTDIARDTYSVCQVLARAFKQYKNEKGKFYLRCKDCGLADCFKRICYHGALWTWNRAALQYFNMHSIL